MCRIKFLRAKDPLSIKIYSIRWSPNILSPNKNVGPFILSEHMLLIFYGKFAGYLLVLNLITEIYHLMSLHPYIHSAYLVAM